MAQSPGSSGGLDEALSFLLIGLGVVLIVGGALGGLGMVVVSPAIGAAWWDAGMVAAGGMTAGVMFFGLAAILRTQGRQAREAQRTVGAIEGLRTSVAELEETLRAVSALGGTGGGAGEAGGGRAVPLATSPPTDLFEVLGEMRELLLMSEAERAGAAERNRAAKKELLVRRVEQQLKAQDWGGAGEVLGELSAGFGEDGQVVELRGQLEAGRAASVQQEVAGARERIRHLMSISAWDQAAEAAAQLQRKYPGAAEPAEMGQEIARERQAFEQEYTQRLFLDLADATDHRRWRRAVEVAEEILRRGASDRRAEKLRHDLETLRENAAAQERKEQEELFKDLLKRQRYQEAIDVAHALIHKFPLSPAAAELINLLPKVQDLLHAQRAGRTGPPAG